MRYEGYGPGGAAVLIDCVTQDGERTAAELRRLFTAHGGHLGARGAVSYLFSEVGLLTYGQGAAGTAAELVRRALAAGAEDVVLRPDARIEVITDPVDFGAVRTTLAQAGFAELTACVTERAATTVELSGDPARAMRGLLAELSHHASVQVIYTNAQLADERLAPV